MQICITASLYRLPERSRKGVKKHMKSLAIEREFGSGGREIGKLVAEKAGIPYYDGELLIKEAELRGVSLELLKDYDEQKTGSLLYNISLLANYHDGSQNKIYEMSERLHTTIKNLELEGPAVFIGRCSTDILRNPRTVRVYIYSSDEEKKRKRIVRTEQVSEETAGKLMKKKDKQRREYFKFWTQKEWAERGNYDMELNTGILSAEKCADILLCAMGSKK